MTGKLPHVLLLLFLTVAMMTLAPDALAIDLDTAKSQGYVGERPDGLLGLVREDAPAEVVALVEEVNAKRLAEYRRIAEENGIAVKDVQALAGKKAIERTPPGGWVYLDGVWRRKAGA